MAKKSKKLTKKQVYLAAAIVIFTSISLLFIIYKSNNQKAQNSSAAYSITKNETSIQANSTILKFDNGEVATPGIGGVWSFTESHSKNGSYPYFHSKPTALQDKEQIVLTSKSSSGNSNYTVVVIFHKDDTSWWINGVFASRERKSQRIDLSSLHPLYPSESELSENDFWTEMYNTVIGEKIPLGQAFKGDLRIPMYIYDLTSKKTGKHWAELVVKGATIKAFK